MQNNNSFHGAAMLTLSNGHSAPLIISDGQSARPVTDGKPKAQRTTISQIEGRLNTFQQDLEERFDTVKQEVDLLQIATTERKRPWYLDLTLIISVLAFLFSLGTTSFSYWQARQQQIHDDRMELRSLLQRLSTLPRENAALPTLYPDARVRGQISGYLQTENGLLVRQAAELMQRLRQLATDQVSSTEYLLVATAMYMSNLPEESLQLFKTAEDVIRDSNDGVAIYRWQGGLLLQKGDFAAGRAAFAQALKIFERYPTTNTYYQGATNAQTEMNWARAEFEQKQCAEAKTHIQKAKALIEAVVPPGLPNEIQQQVVDHQTDIDRCMVQPSAAAPSRLRQSSIAPRRPW